MYPALLQSGDKIQVVAPALSLPMISDELVVAANQAFEKLGIESDASDAVYEVNNYGSASIKTRVEDIHTAFADPTVKGIFAVVGGTNSNEILPYLDYELMAKNPKIFCGFSDATALQNAIYARTGLVTYSGPNWSTLAMKEYSEQTLAWFIQTLISGESTVVEPTTWFTDDHWYAEPENRKVFETEGWWVLQDGEVEGIAIGGNLSTLNLLKGTPYMPELAEKILLVECEAPLDYGTFKRDLHGLLQVPGAESIRALLIGRTQVQSRITREGIEDMVADLPLPEGIPVLANLDFGHTNPMMTFPVGGHIKVTAGRTNPRIVIPAPAH